MPALVKCDRCNALIARSALGNEHWTTSPRGTFPDIEVVDMIKRCCQPSANGAENNRADGFCQLLAEHVRFRPDFPPGAQRDDLRV